MKNFGLTVPSNVNQWVALAGLALVVFATFGVPAFWPSWMIPVIGAFIGFAVVGDVKGFLIAGLALLAAKWGLGHVPVLGHYVQEFTQNLIALVAPAMLVVSVRAIYEEIKG